MLNHFIQIDESFLFQTGVFKLSELEDGCLPTESQPPES